ncbi:MAG: DUF134 domain-containing protein [Candidatus Heimdallarchaeota archaeon]|nr:DUF134 domain-containing protein [Candidatus Heimdallarchaeota archaeon]
MPRLKRGRGGHGRGRYGRGFRGGRPRVTPAISSDFYHIEGGSTLQLTPAELEALKLIDEENLTQEEAAERMKISRSSFWRILDAARKKVVTSLLTGKQISVIIEKPTDE